MSEQITLEEFLALKKQVQYLTKKVKTLEKELEKKDFDETFKDFEAFVEKADRERRAEIYHAWDDFCEPF